jgi:trehalose 6-phosphate synthase
MLGVGARIGFFLHIPLPPPELLTALPRHEELFETLADYDLVGVQTESDLRSLRAYWKDVAGCALHGDMVSTAGGRRFRIGAFPIGINTQRIASQAQLAAKSGATRGLQSSLQGRALAIGVDRLDYSKGIPERFDAFGRFLDAYVERKRQILFMQIAPLSREDVPEYRALRERLEQMAGAINGRHAEPDWMPIRYINRSFRQATLAGFYRTAHIGLVTPLRDGMNLVAKEFVAAQAPDDPGTLVLSRFAGAASELRDALIINPFDPDDTAEAIEIALSMSLNERTQRWRSMMDHLERHDIDSWREAFLDALEHPTDSD